jgi:hypothetical protein
VVCAEVRFAEPPSAHSSARAPPFSSAS